MTSDASDRSLAQAMGYLEELLAQTEYPYTRLSEGNGFSLGLSPKNWDVDPVLIAGRTNFWLLISIPGSDRADRLKALETVNALNSSAPYGVFYVNDGTVTFRNTIRAKTLVDFQELVLWIVVSLSIIDDSTPALRKLTAP